MAKTLQIGRHTNNDVIITDSSVSRHHIQLTRHNDGHFTVIDLNSANGTFINGEIIPPNAPITLDSSDILKIGDCMLPWRHYFDKALSNNYLVEQDKAQATTRSTLYPKPFERLLAYAIDWLLTWPPIIGLTYWRHQDDIDTALRLWKKGMDFWYILRMGREEAIEITLFLLVSGWICRWLYFALFESILGATPPKSLFKMMLRDVNNQPISFYRASIRYWARLLSVLSMGFGYAMTTWQTQRQCLHDKISRCIVYRKQTTN